jgi:RND superfamily putative drug exporter
VIKLLGLGLASAVFLDAFVVRTMLVPAIMHRLGTTNWWYPSGLDKITPRISIEPPDEPTAAEASHGVSELSMPR